MGFDTRGLTDVAAADLAIAGITHLVDDACAAQTGGHEQDPTHPELGGGDADHLVCAGAEQRGGRRVDALDREQVEATDVHFRHPISE